MSNTNPPPPCLPAIPTTKSTSIPFPIPPPTLFSTPSDPSSSSSSTPTPCTICASPSKYTCPRCSLPTCSADCSKTHKSKFSCSGERDPAKFVDLKSYSQGTWGDDFRYLEESRRKILGWGEGLPRDSALLSSSRGGSNGSRGALRGGGSAGGGRGGQRGGRGGAGAGAGGMMNHLSNTERRVNSWKREMQRRGCWVETMPEGMSRRKENSSGWNQRSHIVVLTVHISIPPDLLSPSPTQQPSGPNAPTLIKHPRVIFSSPSSPSATLASLLPNGFSTDLSSIVFLLPFHPSPARPTPPLAGPRRPRLYFPPLDPNAPLDQVLRGTSWIEFPVIQIMKHHTWIILKAKGDFQVVDKADVGPYVPSIPPQGKRLVEEVGAKPTNGEALNPALALGGLADYASDEDEDDQDIEDEGNIVLDEAGAAEHVPQAEEEIEEGEEDDVAGILGAIEIPGGAEMMQKVSEALLADFGVADESPDGEADSEVIMKEVETRR